MFNSVALRYTIFFLSMNIQFRLYERNKLEEENIWKIMLLFFLNWVLLVVFWADVATCTLFGRDLLFCCDAKNIILPIFLQIMARFRRYLISEYFCKNDHRDGETLTQSVPVLSWLPISAAVNRGYSLVSIAAVIIASVCFILCFFCAKPRRVDQSRPAVGKHSIYTCRTPLQLLLLLESRLFVWKQL